jgi:O-antigen ligase
MVATLMNASRGVILAIILSVVFLFVNLKIKTTWKILFVLLSAVFLYYVYTSSTFELLFARFAEEDSTASGRTSIWGTKLSWFLEGSITDVLFGKGHDTAVKYGGMGFHNDFIAALVEYGIVGLLILLSAFLYPLRLSSKQNRIPVCALILYLAIVSCSIEPITTGSFAPLAYLFFITQYSCLSKTN